MRSFTLITVAMLAVLAVVGKADMGTGSTASNKSSDESGSTASSKSSGESGSTASSTSSDESGNSAQPIKTLAPGACSIDFTKHDETYVASLESFEKVSNKTVNGGNGTEPVVISPCEKMSFADNKDLNNCSDVLGYMAFNGADGKCAVMNKKVVKYNPNSFEFNSTYTNTNMLRSGLLGAEQDTKRYVIVKCGTTDSSEGVQTRDTITYTSKAACGTKATAAPKEPEGLSTGAIVGIVIGCLALIVIILVICRWKSAKKEGEGEYSRV